MVTTLQFDGCWVSKLLHSLLWITSLRVAQALLQNPLWPDCQEQIQEAFVLQWLRFFQGKDHQRDLNLLGYLYYLNLIFRLILYFL